MGEDEGYQSAIDGFTTSSKKPRKPKKSKLVPWSKEVSLKSDYIETPFFPDGAVIDVKFECGKCGQELIADVDIPSVYFDGDNEAESRIWGDAVDVECDCGAIYELLADNSTAGWDVNFEGEKLPKTFRFKVYPCTLHSWLLNIKKDD